ncbi:MAG: hypothetical protein H6591_14445 [Flavobacteriales bacterium]|nr:hypothetical protein [Flavobacteriales bacterium]
MNEGSPHLVPLKPALFNDRVCPRCGTGSPKAVRAVFPGVHVLGEYECGACGYAFFHDLPVGFAVDHDVAIGKDDGTMHDAKGAEPWVTGPLMKGYAAQSDEEVRIERRVLRPCKRVVVLNTLDFLYGHVLLKLWNAQYYLDAHAELGLVVIIPRSFEWLIPQGAAEAWIVDQRLGQAHGWYRSIDRQVNAFLADYDEAFLGKGYAHPDKSKVDIERFTGVRPFDVDTFATAPPRITYVLREDRLWFRTPLHKLKYRTLMRFGLKGIAHWYFLRDQQRLALASLKRIQAAVPGAMATIVGLGDALPVPEGVQDLRTRTMSVEVEREWCRAYAASQIVIGVHGSNMLLPTALAGGCIEVLPFDRYGNIVQDVAVRCNDVMLLFLYRFVDEFASARTVARQAISMFRDFPVFHRNNRINVP